MPEGYKPKSCHINLYHSDCSKSAP